MTESVRIISTTQKPLHSVSRKTSQPRKRDVDAYCMSAEIIQFTPAHGAESPGNLTYQ